MRFGVEKMLGYKHKNPAGGFTRRDFLKQISYLQGSLFQKEFRLVRQFRLSEPFVSGIILAVDVDEILCKMFCHLLVNNSICPVYLSKGFLKVGYKGIIGNRFANGKGDYLPGAFP